MNNEFLNESDYDFQDKYAENEIRGRMQRCYISDWAKPMEFYESEHFRKRYRFIKAAVIYILLPMVNYELRGNDYQELPIAPIMQI